MSKKCSELTPEQRDRNNSATAKSMKKRRAKLKEEGKCVDCGKQREEGRVSVCAKCVEDRTDREHRRWMRDIPKGKANVQR